MLNRDEIVRRALRAAAAVTGRASKWGRVSAAVGLVWVGGMGVVGCVDNMGTAEEAERVQTAPANADGAGADSVGDTSSTVATTEQTTAGTADVYAADGSVLADSADPTDTLLVDTSVADPDVGTATCGYNADGIFDWRCCTDVGADEWPVWVTERNGCSFCFADMAPDADWDTTWACCTTIFSTLDAACAAETETTAQSECYNANSAIYSAIPHCTPWGPPAPPRWTGVSLAALAALTAAPAQSSSSLAA